MRPSLWGPALLAALCQALPAPVDEAAYPALTKYTTWESPRPSTTILNEDPATYTYNRKTYPYGTTWHGPISYSITSLLPQPSAASCKGSNGPAPIVINVNVNVPGAENHAKVRRSLPIGDLENEDGANIVLGSRSAEPEAANPGEGEIQPMPTLKELAKRPVIMVGTGQKPDEPQLLPGLDTKIVNPTDEDALANSGVGNGKRGTSVVGVGNFEVKDSKAAVDKIISADAISDMPGWTWWLSPNPKNENKIEEATSLFRRAVRWNHLTHLGDDNVDGNLDDKGGAANIALTKDLNVTSSLSKRQRAEREWPLEDDDVPDLPDDLPPQGGGDFGDGFNSDSGFTDPIEGGIGGSTSDGPSGDNGDDGVTDPPEGGNSGAPIDDSGGDLIARSLHDWKIIVSDKPANPPSQDLGGRSPLDPNFGRVDPIDGDFACPPEICEKIPKKDLEWKDPIWLEKTGGDGPDGRESFSKRKADGTLPLPLPKALPPKVELTERPREPWENGKAKRGVIVPCGKCADNGLEIEIEDPDSILSKEELVGIADEVAEKLEKRNRQLNQAGQHFRREWSCSSR